MGAMISAASYQPYGLWVQGRGHLVEIDSAPEDDDLPLSITHHRDIIAFGGSVEQDYRFLVYRFASEHGEIEARTYLDDIWEVSITSPIDLSALPPDVEAYLRHRFNVIQQMGGPDGYRVIWRRK
jgi:hypothetical protein